MADWRRITLWLLVGIIAALFIQWTQVQALGGRWDSLVYVGEEAPARTYITNDLPDLAIVDHVGHDGQTVYIVARDPFMTTGAAAAAFDAPGFRYRRIGYPLIAGLFGTLTPTGIVIGMIVVAAAAFAVSAAAVTSLPGPRSSTARGAIAVMVAPGL